MLFNSFEFLLFFPVVTVAYFILPFRARWLLLLLASCVFYMAFVPKYILILGLTIVVDYFAGIAIESAKGRRRKVFLAASLVANIGVLAVFKYWNFFHETLTTILSPLGVHNDLPLLRMLLPIGLSFHTFQAMSYTIEVYRGNQAAERHFGIYALYVMFYPQLVAGPIERPQNVLGQFHVEHHFEYDRVVSGLQRMAWGLFKKVVIADKLAVLVNDVYNVPQKYHGLALIVATSFFAFQIYYDFSGYSDVALGSAEVMGFKLMTNFRTPYFSSSIREFWGRWHISLSSWFRDYLYIPLGGNRVSRPRWFLNQLTVFFVSGLWHGANWTFIIWGLIHGVYLIIGELTKARRETLWSGSGHGTSTVRRLLATGATFALVSFAWIFFRATTVKDAWYIATHLTTGLVGDLIALKSGTFALPLGAVVRRFLVVGAVMWAESIDGKEGLFKALSRRPLVVRYAVYLFLIYSTLLWGQDQQQFIYFQF